MSILPDFDPNLDLIIDRVVPVSPEKVFRAWTTPKHLEQWFCPKPWFVSDVEIDLRPGGAFRSVMHGPDGERFENTGCYLEIVPNQRLVWTDALLPGFRPADKPFFSAILILEPHPEGTRYIAIARHGNPDTRAQHEQMGFQVGWNIVIDQMVAAIQAE